MKTIKEEQFEDGDKVYLKPEYADIPNERYTLSQWDGNKCWIGDKDGRGWYVRGYQICKKLPSKS